MSSSELSPSLTSILTDSTADFFRERLPAKLSTAGKRASASNQRKAAVEGFEGKQCIAAVSVDFTCILKMFLVGGGFLTTVFVRF
jgi:hypothetical protein